MRLLQRAGPLMPLNTEQMKLYMREYRKKHRALSGKPSKVDFKGADDDLPEKKGVRRMDTRIGSLTPAQTVEYTEYLASRGKRLVNVGGLNPMWTMEAIPEFVPGQYPEPVHAKYLPICHCGNPPVGMFPGMKVFRTEWDDGSVYEHSVDHCHHYSPRDVSYLERPDDRGVISGA